MGGVRLLGVTDALDGDDVLSVEARKRRQTRVYASMIDLFGRRVVLADDNGASTATTFAASSIH